MGENKDKGFLVFVVLGAIFIIIMIWLLTQKKKKDADNGNGGNGGNGGTQPDEPSLTWHDYDVRDATERWFGHPSSSHWTRLDHTIATPVHPIETWHFWIFPHPGGDPYTGAGQQIGIGGSLATLGDLQKAVQNSWRANADYPRSRNWLDYMVENVLPGYGYDVNAGN